jgi:hypothetical protein
VNWFVQQSDRRPLNSYEQVYLDPTGADVHEPEEEEQEDQKTVSLDQTVVDDEDASDDARTQVPAMGGVLAASSTVACLTKVRHLPARRF